MSLITRVSKYGNIVKKSFVSKLEGMGKDKTTPYKEDIFANPNLETQGKSKFVQPDKYDPNK
jgi:hypothetical protein